MCSTKKTNQPLTVRQRLSYPLICGENEIRTRDTLLAYTRFPGVPLQPLEHLSLQLPTREKTLHKNRKQQKAAF